MASVTIERRLPAPPEKVFAMISKTEHLVKWWGHENMTLIDHNLSFENLGPWYSVLLSDEGNRMKMSGQVTHCEAPHSVGFTWAWHDDEDARGAESPVTIRLKPDKVGGTAFTLTHDNLATEDVAARHGQGWASTLRRLESLAAAETENPHA